MYNHPKENEKDYNLSGKSYNDRESLKRNSKSGKNPDIDPDTTIPLPVMKIEVTERPKASQPWILPKEQLEYKDDWIAMMLKTRRLSECSEEELIHVVPHFPVKGKEKSGYNRVVGSFQQLNAVTKPMKSDHADCLDLATWHSQFRYRGKIDLSKGFYNMRLDEDSKKYCGIRHRGRYFKYNVLPMGVKNGPNGFRDWLNSLLDRLPPDIRQYVRIFLDDILYGNDDKEACILIENAIYELLLISDVNTNEDKCIKTTEDTIPVLGFAVGYKTVGIDPQKLSKIKERLKVALGTSSLTKRRRAQLLGALQALARTDPHLDALLKGMYVYMNQLPQWETQLPWQSDERLLLRRIMEHLDSAAPTTPAEGGKSVPVYSDSSMTHVGLKVGGKTYS